MPDDKDVLMERAMVEVGGIFGRLYQLDLHLDLGATMMLVAGLQLALRHPENTGISADETRKMIDSIIGTIQAAGLPANAEILRLGHNPAYDDEVTNG